MRTGSKLGPRRHFVSGGDKWGACGSWGDTERSAAGPKPIMQQHRFRRHGNGDGLI